MKKRQPSRRKFHTLHLDFTLVLLVALALVSHVLRPMPGKSRTSGARPVRSPFPAFEISFSEPTGLAHRPFPDSAGSSFSPDLPDKARIPPDAAASPFLGADLEPLDFPVLSPPSLPHSAVRPSFPPAQAPFSEPPPAVAVPQPAAGSAKRIAEAFVFRDGDDPFSVVFVNAFSVLESAAITNAAATAAKEAAKTIYSPVSRIPIGL